MGVRVNGGHVPGKKKARLCSGCPRLAVESRGQPAAGRGGNHRGPPGRRGLQQRRPPARRARPRLPPRPCRPPRRPPRAAASSGAASSLEQQYEQVVARVLPSVVQISTSEGSGSGVVYDAKGDIVTNAHVVGTATTVQVGLASGGKPLAAKVVGVFAPDDLAVIRVQGGTGSLHPATFGRSAAVRGR